MSATEYMINTRTGKAISALVVGTPSTRKILTPVEIKARLSVIFAPKEGIPNAEWIAYENGTFYIINEDDSQTIDDMKLEANAALQIFQDGVAEGTSLGDFTVLRQEKRFAENEYVYCVQYEGRLFTLIEESVADKETILIGLEARELRTKDAKDLKIVCTSRNVNVEKLVQVIPPATFST